MSQIIVLSREISELIAAGEVIERPASVVKELIENSIDAGSNSIRIDIRNGGIQYIKITDNGCGIERSDLPKAFLRHSTSKIKSIDDLDNITTLGFRGEALASICAVAKVEVITKTKDEVIGSHFILHGDNAGELDEIGSPNGTTFIVKDLFYNVPARLKFLKKDVTEGNAIASLIDRICISHPEIAFSFYRDGELQVQTSGNGDLKSAIISVFGTQYYQSLLPVDYEENNIQIKGYIAKPEISKSSRSMQLFYINNRYIKSVTIMTALEEAFRHAIMVGKFPIAFLFLTINPSDIDVNIHPAKIEIKLSDEKTVFNIVFRAVKNTLNVINQVIDYPVSSRVKYNNFSLNEEPNTGVQVSFKSNLLPNKSINERESYSNNYIETPIIKKTDNYENPLSENRLKEFCVDENSTIKPVSNDQTSELNDDNVNLLDEVSAVIENNYEIIGDLFDTYFVIANNRELLLVDKHAAHERILFNKISSEFYQNSIETQLLLQPSALTLSKIQYDAAILHLDIIKRLGYEIEDFGNGSILIRSVPSILIDCDYESLLEELIDSFSKTSNNSSDSFFDFILQSMACKGAIKGNNFTHKLERNVLLDMLFSDPSIRNCPHGRPIILSFSKYEIEKMFGRIQ